MYVPAQSYRTRFVAFGGCQQRVSFMSQERAMALPEENWRNPWGDSDGSDSDDSDQAILDEPMMWDEDSFETALAAQNECVSGVVSSLCVFAKHRFLTTTAKSYRRYVDRLEVLTDLDKHGQQFIAARGGDPGMGNRSMPRWEQKPDVRCCVERVRDGCAVGMAVLSAYACM